MTEIMEEDKVTIKEESTENQGKVKYIIYICIYLLRMIDF